MLICFFHCYGCLYCNRVAGRRSLGKMNGYSFSNKDISEECVK
jgi:hypothetical protein